MLSITKCVKKDRPCLRDFSKNSRHFWKPESQREAVEEIQVLEMQAQLKIRITDMDGSDGESCT